jgi:hypothetical protein
MVRAANRLDPGRPGDLPTSRDLRANDAAECASAAQHLFAVAGAGLHRTIRHGAASRPRTVHASRAAHDSHLFLADMRAAVGICGALAEPKSAWRNHAKSSASVVCRAENEEARVWEKCHGRCYRSAAAGELLLCCEFPYVHQLRIAIKDLRRHSAH